MSLKRGATKTVGVQKTEEEANHFSGIRTLVDVWRPLLQNLFSNFSTHPNPCGCGT